MKKSHLLRHFFSIALSLSMSGLSSAQAKSDINTQEKDENASWLSLPGVGVFSGFSAVGSLASPYVTNFVDNYMLAAYRYVDIDNLYAKVLLEFGVTIQKDNFLNYASTQFPDSKKEELTQLGIEHIRSFFVRTEVEIAPGGRTEVISERITAAFSKLTGKWYHFEGFAEPAYGSSWVGDGRNVRESFTYKTVQPMSDMFRYYSKFHTANIKALGLVRFKVIDAFSLRQAGLLLMATAAASGVVFLAANPVVLGAPSLLVATAATFTIIRKNPEILTNVLGQLRQQVQKPQA